MGQLPDPLFRCSLPNPKFWVNGCETELKGSLGMIFLLENWKILELVCLIQQQNGVSVEHRFPTQRSGFDPSEGANPLNLFWCLATVLAREYFKNGALAEVSGSWPKWLEMFLFGLNSKAGGERFIVWISTLRISGHARYRNALNMKWKLIRGLQIGLAARKEGRVF